MHAGSKFSNNLTLRHHELAGNERETERSRSPYQCSHTAGQTIAQCSTECQSEGSAETGAEGGLEQVRTGLALLPECCMYMTPFHSNV